MKTIIYALILGSSLTAHAGETVKVTGVAKGYFDEQETVGQLIEQLKSEADRNALKKNDLCRIQQVRTSEYRINLMPDYLGIKYKVDADYICGSVD